MKLSYSATSKYLTCPKMYELHYIKRIRSKFIGSPLPFGSALDDAFSYLLLDKKKEHTEEEKKLLEHKSAKELFLHCMTSINFNGKDILLKTSEYVQYGKADWQLELLTEDDIEQIKDIYDYGDSLADTMQELYLTIRQGGKLDDNMLLFYNRVCWLCLVQKGYMLLDAYEEEIMPQIEEVYSIQEKVELPDDSGNVVIGYIDFTCKFIDDDAKYIVDNKTSSKPYKMSDLVDSRQLHTYAEFKDYDHIAYVVAEKNIRKREPRARINILKGKVVDKTFDLTFDEYSDTLAGIESGEFDMTSDSSKCKMQFGKPCIYYNVCHAEKFDKDKLEKLK